MIRDNLAALADICPDLLPSDEPSTAEGDQGSAIRNFQEPRSVRFTQYEPSMRSEESHAEVGRDHVCFVTVPDLEALMCASRGLRTVAQTALDYFMPIDLSADDADLGEYPHDPRDYDD